uniref:Immunoglobulin heavy variable 4-2 n=1 Tax=Cyprinus carpio TaxID=7962 RepID=A0A8C2H9I9_CYPCA
SQWSFIISSLCIFKRIYDRLQNLDLSCRGSGFTFRSYDMHWVRQKPGKALVWMGHVWISGQRQDYVKKRRLEITRDDSKSMMYLKLSGLTEEDSGMYFCARQAHQSTAAEFLCSFDISPILPIHCL